VSGEATREALDLFPRRSTARHGGGAQRSAGQWPTTHQQVRAQRQPRTRLPLMAPQRQLRIEDVVCRLPLPGSRTTSQGILRNDQPLLAPSEPCAISKR
jgi:hypothetical protein